MSSSRSDLGELTDSGDACTRPILQNDSKVHTQRLDLQTVPHADVSSSKNSSVNLVISFGAGFVLWLLTLSLCVGFAAWVFHDAEYAINRGIAMQVLGTGIVYLVTGCKSRYPALCSQPSPVPCLYYSAFVSAAVKSCEGDVLDTSQVFIMLATGIFGLATLVATSLRAGRVLEYFPESVLTGYVGGIGTLIIRSALTLLSGADILEDSAAFMEEASLRRVGIGVSLGIVIFIVMRIIPHPALQIFPIIVATAIFYVIVFILQMPLQDLRDGGWIFPYYPSLPFHELWTKVDLQKVDVGLIMSNGPSLVLQLIFLTCIAQYSSAAAVLNEFVGSTSQVDSESRNVGIANTLCGLCSGMVVTTGMAPSAVGVAMKADSRAQVVCGCLHILLFLSGFSLVSYIPKVPLCGCLLLPTGIKMIYSSLVDSRAKYSFLDHLCIVIICVTVVLRSVQDALIIGLILNFILMLYLYSQVDPVYNRTSLASSRSIKDRDVEQRSIIQEHCQTAKIWQVKGVLFLGNFVALKRELTTTMDEESAPKFMILDFELVPYIERSVWGSLVQMDKQAANRSIELLVCGLDEKLKKQLREVGGALSNLKLVRSLPLALERVEDRILDTHRVRSSMSQLPFSKLALRLGSSSSGDKAWAEDELAKYFKVTKPEAEELVCEQDHLSRALYFVAGGEFHMYLEQKSTKSHVLLRKILHGGLFGTEALTEMDVYRASVECKIPGPVLRLGREDFSLMRERSPHLAFDVLLEVARTTAESGWLHTENIIQPEKVEVRNKSGVLKRMFTLADGLVDGMNEPKADCMTQVVECLRPDPPESVGEVVCGRGLTHQSKTFYHA